MTGSIMAAIAGGLLYGLLSSMVQRGALTLFESVALFLFIAAFLGLVLIGVRE